MLIARDHRLATVNAQLDRALDRRVELHRARAADEIDVNAYQVGLREVRNVEAELEPVRRDAGCVVSRAVELGAAEGHEAAARLVIEREAARYPTPPDPRQALLESLSERQRADILAGGGKPDWTGCSGSGGPMRCSIAWHSGVAQVDAFSPAEWAAEVAWHTYWGAHAYDTLNPELAAAAPASPQRPRKRVKFTLAEVRELVREAQSPQVATDPHKQLSSRKSDWRCEKCGSTNDVAGWPRRCVDCNPPQIFKPGRPAPTPLAAQLDLDGGVHEIAPHTRQERLFAPAPTQLAGQTSLAAVEVEFNIAQHMET